MSTCTPTEITVEGVTYVPKTDAPAETLDGMPFVLIRTTTAGVHVGAA